MNYINFQNLEICLRCISIITAYIDTLEVKEVECFQFSYVIKLEEKMAKILK